MFTAIRIANQARITCWPCTAVPKSSLPMMGAKTGSTIRQISIQSKKKPITKTSAITKIITSQPVSMPAPFRIAATRSSPPSARNT